MLRRTEGNTSVETSAAGGPSDQSAFELFQYQLEPYQRKSNARKLVD